MSCITTWHDELRLAIGRTGQGLAPSAPLSKVLVVLPQRPETLLPPVATILIFTGRLLITLSATHHSNASAISPTATAPRNHRVCVACLVDFILEIALATDVVCNSLELIDPLPPAITK